MKAALLVLAITAAPAAADPDPVRMRAAEPGSEPVFQPGASEATCEDLGAGRVLSVRRVVGTTTAIVVHDCGMDAMSVLALHTSRGWFTSQGMTIAYHAGNMTEYPLRVSLVAERLVTGTLADGTRALVQIVETAERTDTTERVLAVQICSADDDPACGFVRYGCGGKTCPATVRLSRGTLIIGTERRRVLR